VPESKPTSGERFTEFSDRISHVEAAVSHIGQSVKSLVDSVEQIRSDVKTAGKTQWGWIIGGAGLIGSLFLAFLQAPLRDLARHELGIVELAKQHVTHITTDGHPAMVQRVGSLEEGMEKLDQVLQREMRLLDEQLQNEFNSRIEDAASMGRESLKILRERGENRFTKEDYDKYVLPVITKIQKDLEDIRKRVKD